MATMHSPAWRGHPVATHNPQKVKRDSIGCTSLMPARHEAAEYLNVLPHSSHSHPNRAGA